MWAEVQSVGYFPQFVKEKVVFSQFRERLRDHRKRMSEKHTRAAEEMQNLLHDRALYPKKTHNHHGKPVFSCSPAAPLLEQDVKEKNHKSLSLGAFHHSRTEYKSFDRDVFNHRILQQEKREKFMNYLEYKREEKRRGGKKKKKKKDDTTTEDNNNHDPMDIDDTQDPMDLDI